MSSFKQMLNKEMAMANSSYARAAGIQSEISKVTVTRVASSEVECKRQTNLYRKDMIISVNSISREQRILRKSMVKYSKKKYQHRLEKQKREKQRLEKEQRERDELEKWEKINSILNLKMTTVDEPTNESLRENEDNTLTVSDENNNEMDKKELEQEENCEQVVEKPDSINPFEVLPSIKDSEIEKNPEGESTKGEKNDVVTNNIFDNSSPSTADTNNSTEETLDQFYTLTIRPLKPRKQIVSFSDIIKLKHSHNTDKLFDMVNVLAQKHRVNESVEKRRAERRNSKIPRGSTDAVISESLRKAASVLYPMKYGYGDQGTTDKPFDQELLKADKVESSRGTIGSKGTSIASSDLPKVKRAKRNRSYLSDELKKEDMLRNGIVDEDKKFKNLSTRSSSSFLPAINPLGGKNSSNIPKHPRNNSVSWTEAFGLLKVVHNVQTIDEY